MCKYLIGFDPGGKGKFGWCVVEDRRRTPLHVIRVGLADHAEGAVQAAYEVVQAKKGNEAIGVGIDAPLFWVASGCRAVDSELRERIRERGAPNAAGTVQQVNSLRGACLVQGMLAGVLSRQRTSGVAISESHPKAMLWLLERNPAQVRLQDMPEKFDLHDGVDDGDHLRDAAVACLSAWAMVHNPNGWRDRYPLDEHHAYSCIVAPVAYWMPEAVP